MHLTYFGVLLPYLVVRAARRAKPDDAPVANRAKYFRTTAFVCVMLGLVSMATAGALGLTMFPAHWPPPVALPAAAGVYGIAVAFMRPRWRRAVRERPKQVQRFLAVTPTERVWWIAVAVLAGVWEEVTWRGVQPVLLAHVLSSESAAVLLCAVLFGAAHATQGWRSASLIVVLALGFHVLVLLTGSLYAAMAVHVAYDITAGLTMGRFARELGSRAPGKAPPPQGPARALDNV
jgi:membrane protease YdiL (CAAX protease family)